MADRIAFFFGNFSGGGVQRVRLVLAREFFSRGLEVDLVVVNRQGDLRSRVPEGVGVVDLGARRSALALPKLVKYLRAAKPKAILSSQTHHNILAIIARRVSGIPTRLVVGEHHNLIENRKDEGLPAFLHLLAARFIYPHADAILAVSKGVAESIRDALGIPGDMIWVIYNPIDILELLKKTREQIDHHWFDHPKIPVIIGVGRLSKEKDFPTLIESIAHLKKTREVHLLILGDGEERDKLDLIIRQHDLERDVQLLGFVDNPYAYLSRASLFVLSSRREGFPNVLLEALACGTPAVATDCPSGPAELLENGRFGRLVPVGEPQALASAIDKTLENPLESETLVQRARDFSVELIGDQYLDLLLGNRSKKGN